jgi:ParB family chromosome partitioning protein
MTDERYTEQWVIDAARATMGAIDLDPASCVAANARVGAARYYDKDTDGLARPWFGRVFTNPPYSRANGFIAKLLREWEEGRVTQAVLVFSSRDTGFLVDRGQPLLRHGAA